MDQDRESGERARRFGKSAAIQCGALLKATRLSKRSNEFEYRGERICIKSARLGNKRIMATNALTDRVKAFVVALEIAPSIFELFYVPKRVFRRRSKPMRSRRFEGKAREIDRESLVDQKCIRRAVKLKS